VDGSEITVLRDAGAWVALDKPAGLLVHPTKPDGEYTLWHRLGELYPGESFFLSNRLDRETSGVVLAARGRDNASKLGKLVMARAIRKEYYAIVEGFVLRDRGVVEAPILRQGTRMPSEIYVKQCVHPEGALSKTEYWVVRRMRGYTLVRVRLHTGRLHQIRVHFSSIGHPVAGDKIYGQDERCYLDFIETGWTEELSRRLALPRHALHARSVEFVWEGVAVRVESPLPCDLQEFVEKVR